MFGSLIIVSIAIIILVVIISLVFATKRKISGKTAVAICIPTCIVFGIVCGISVPNYINATKV